MRAAPEQLVDQPPGNSGQGGSDSVCMRSRLIMIAAMLSTLAGCSDAPPSEATTKACEIMPSLADLTELSDAHRTRTSSGAVARTFGTLFDRLLEISRDPEVNPDVAQSAGKAWADFQIIFKRTPVAEPFDTTELTETLEPVRDACRSAGATVPK